MKNKFLIFLLLLMFCTINISFSTVFASGGEDSVDLSINAAWVDGDMIRINVKNKQNNSDSSLAIDLTDYINDNDNNEYIDIQAADLDGNKSEIIQLKNPYYKPSEKETEEPAENKQQEKENAKDGEDDKTVDATGAIDTTGTGGTKPFTPEGSGEVMDNAESSDGKEFFTIKTDDENVFYLIVDRQRNSDNVYLLNAVTEDDLKALAQQSGNNASSGSSAISTPTPIPEPTTVPAPIPEVPIKSSNNTMIFVVIAIIMVGGAGYYFKIVKPKRELADNDEEIDDYDEEKGEDFGSESYGSDDAIDEYSDEDDYGGEDE